MIHANRLTRRIANFELFSDVSFFLPKGSYTCLTGNSGSGKTTLLEMIAGRLRPDSGSLKVNEVDLTSAGVGELLYMRREIGYVESTPSLLLNRSTTDNIRLPLEIAGFDLRAAAERVDATLDTLGLKVLADIPVQRLTTDQQWMVACARATVHLPQVVLIDEACGVSASIQEQQSAIAERLSTAGATVVIAGKPANSVDFRIELKEGRSYFDSLNKTARHEF